MSAVKNKRLKKNFVRERYDFQEKQGSFSHLCGGYIPKRYRFQNCINWMYVITRVESSEKTDSRSINRRKSIRNEPRIVRQNAPFPKMRKELFPVLRKNVVLPVLA